MARIPGVQLFPEAAAVTGTLSPELVHSITVSPGLQALCVAVLGKALQPVSEETGALSRGPSAQSLGLESWTRFQLLGRSSSP